MKHFDNNRPKMASYGFSCETWVPRAMPRADQHDEIELNYLLDGAITYLLAGRHVRVPSRRLVAFWAVAPHQIVEFESDSPYYVLTIPFAWFLKWGLPNQFHMRIINWELVIDTAPAHPERERLMFEQWIRDVQNEELSPAAALEIQARIYRMAKATEESHKSPLNPPAVQVESQGKAEQMAAYISRSYENKLTVPEIAAEVGLHPDYAATLFKKTFGTTIVNFITRHRVAHAQRALLSTEDPIISIAGESGFDSLSRFNSAFKQTTGLTPREYRKNRK